MSMLALLPLLLALQDTPDVRATELVTLDSYHPFTPPRSPERWARRRAEVRRRVLVAAGLWPEPPRVPLEPIVHGAIERDGYVVQNVAFQALPGFWVTGSLYRPTTGEGPFPAVLCPHGHWERGRFTVVPEDEARAQIARGEERYLANARHHLQARCAELARLGCLVLHYDMIGYADSRQLDHREGFGDVEAELWGMSHFGLQTLSSIRALDLVLSRDDVDPDRVAVTGGSGGGTQTFVLGAVDDRPAVLFPAVMVSTAMQGGCVCENASHLRVGTGNVELAAMAAPRPLGLTGANDWTIEIETKGLPELRQLYASLGAPENVNAWCYPSFPHNYNLVSRTRLYEWLNWHFRLRHAPPIEEHELVPVPPGELSVWTEEHPRPADARDLAGVREEWLELQRAAAARIVDLVDVDPAEYRRVVGGALETMIAARPSGVGVVEGSEDRLVLSPLGAGHRVTLLRGVGGTRPLTVLEVASGPDAVLPAVDAARVALVMPIGVADGARLPVDAGRHGRYVGYTWGYDRTLLAEQVQDVLTAIAYLVRTEGRPVRLLGRGDAAPAALIAAALAADAVERVALEGGWDFEDVETLDDPRLLPRARCYGGLPAFAALLAPRPLFWRRADAPRVVERAYAEAGARDRLVLSPADDADLRAWLLEP